MKMNAEFAFNKHLENTNLEKILCIPGSAFSPIASVSAPLPNINVIYYHTETQDRHSEIKRSTSHEPQHSIIRTEKLTEQLPILGQDSYDNKADSSGGCTCLIV